MNKRKYQLSLFIIGCITNFLFRYFWLLIPGVILLLVGIFVDVCLYIGLALLVVDGILSLAEQLMIRKTFLSDSENPDFQRFQKALSKDGSWVENFKETVEQKTEE